MAASVSMPDIQIIKQPYHPLLHHLDILLADHIRYGAAANIQAGRDAPVEQVTVKFKAQHFFVIRVLSLYLKTLLRKMR